MDDALLDGRYRPKRRLGAGGMGEVWLAHDERLDRYVAIKRVLLEGGADEQELLRLMRREAVISARLNHPHIVKVHDLLDVGGHPYLVMEYIEGESMADRLRRGPAPAPRDSARLIGQVASGLAVAHRNGVVHRDVKPHNILIDREGVAKLADFGIARAIETMVTLGRGPAGTFAYMAPEIARTGEASPASDVWSLGATFFAATEGHPPHMPPGVQHIGEVFQRILTRDAPRPARSAQFTDLVSRMLSTDPTARPTMADVEAEIRHRRSADGRRHTDPPRRPPPPQPPRPDPPTDGGGPRVPPEHEVLTGQFVYSPRQRAVLAAVVSVIVAMAMLALALTAGDGPGDSSGDGGASSASRGPRDGVTAVGFTQANEIVRLSDEGFDTDGLTVEVGEVVQFRAPQSAYYRLTVGELPRTGATQEEGLSYEFSRAGTYLVALEHADGGDIDEIAIVVG